MVYYMYLCLFLYYCTYMKLMCVCNVCDSLNNNLFDATIFLGLRLTDSTAFNFLKTLCFLGDDLEAPI